MAASRNAAVSSGSSRSSRVLSPPASLVSSFQLVSATHSTQSFDSADDSSDFESLSPGGSSEDEIVWSVSDLSASIISNVSEAHPPPPGLRSPDVFSEDDFIVLARPPSSAPAPAPTPGARREVVASPRRTDPSSVDGLSDALSTLVFDESDDDESVRPTSQAGVRHTRRARRRFRAPSTSSSELSSTPSSPPPRAAQTPSPKKKKGSTPDAESQKKARVRAKRRAKKEAKKAEAQRAKESSSSDDASDASECKAYDDAVQYISSFLSSPTPDAKAKTDLTFLQALIVELGLCSTSAASEQSFCHLPSLPRSIKAAKTLLKSSVFLNVRDYLDQRSKGLEALRKVMHPSRKALVKDLSRGKGQRRVPRDFVKNTGLGVLLVTCYS